MFRPLFTLGHSNHSIERFLELAEGAKIEAIADVRSQPYSKYSPQFSRQRLKASCAAAGVAYAWLGRELGGRPEGREFYDSNGHVIYERIVATAMFQSGLERLIEGAARYRVAMVCAEENPRGCHRHRMVSRALEAAGFPVWHIRADGRLERATEIDAEVQPFLFDAFRHDPPASD